MSVEKVKVTDLRSALELLKTVPGQLIETNELVDPHARVIGGLSIRRCW